MSHPLQKHQPPFLCFIHSRNTNPPFLCFTHSRNTNPLSYVSSTPETPTPFPMFHSLQKHQPPLTPFPMFHSLQKHQPPFPCFTHSRNTNPLSYVSFTPETPTLFPMFHSLQKRQPPFLCFIHSRNTNPLSYVSFTPETCHIRATQFRFLTSYPRELQGQNPPSHKKEHPNGFKFENADCTQFRKDITVSLTGCHPLPLTGKVANFLPQLIASTNHTKLESSLALVNTLKWLSCLSDQDVARCAYRDLQNIICKHTKNKQHLEIILLAWRMRKKL